MAIENIKNINQINYDKMEEGFIKTDFGNMYFKHNESKDQHIKIIMIHGLGGTTKSFAKLIDNLPNDIDIYLIDLLGHGNSDKPKIKYSIDIQVTALSQFIEKTKYSNFYLLGHSYGGFVALKYLLNFGTEKIKALILEDSAGLKEVNEEAKNYKKNMLKKALEFNNEKYVIESIMNQNNELDDSDLQKLDLINIKCLILWGENDKIIDKSYGQALNKYIKGSDLEIIKNAEHVSHYSNAAEVKNLLLKFINYK